MVVELCFIQACWHKSIVDEIRAGFSAEIKGKFPDVILTIIEVPGILEIPLQSKMAAKSGKYAAIIAAGVVTSGGIYKYEYVAHAVVAAIVNIQLEQEIPIISAILMPLDEGDTDTEAYFLKHARLKGKEAAVACVKTLELMGRYRN
jgi:6,7-dimethyl-8-ribityllumazine synthase